MQPFVASKAAANGEGDQVRGLSGQTGVRLAWVVIAGLLSISQTGCVAVGYSSGGGWFVWPGGLGLLLVVLLVIYLLRRR